MLSKDEITILCDALIATYGDDENPVKDKILAKIKAMEPLPEEVADDLVVNHHRGVLGAALKNFIVARGWTVRKEGGKVLWDPPRGYSRAKDEYDFQHAVYSQIHRDRELGLLTPMEDYGGIDGLQSIHERRRRKRG